MKTSSVVVMVVIAHVVTVGMFCMVQGCGTPREFPASGAPAEPVVPVRPRIVVPPSASKQDKPPPRLPRPAETTTYVVQPGDSLSVIAQRFGLSSDAIVGLNNLANPDNISVGQSLLLPGSVDVKAPPARPAASEKQRKEPAPGDNVYVVQPGDTLSEIAAQKGTTISALREATGLSNDRILADQKLIIPLASGTEASVVSELNDKAQNVQENQFLTLENAPDSGTAGTTEGDSVTSATSMRSYTVQEGEDLYSVSLMWDVSAEELKSVNDLTGKELTPGQVLKIPMTP